MKGFVDKYTQPKLGKLFVRGTRSRKISCSPVIDTGFNGFLSLPIHLRKTIKHSFVAEEWYEFADGRRTREKVYLGHIFWDRKWKDVLFSFTRSSDVLLGTRLLETKVLTINFPLKSVELVAFIRNKTGRGKKQK